MTKRSSTPADAVLVAIDMSKHRQEVLIERPEGGRRRRITVMATKEDYERLATDLGDIGRPIVVGFEATGNYHRTLAHRLLAAGFELRLISSVALARTREALHNGWDKNDSKDAQVILHLLRIGATQRYVDPLAAGINDLQELMVEEPNISIIATLVLALADPEAKDVAQRVSRSRIIAPLAAWLGPPRAFDWALNLYSLMAGFVILAQSLGATSIPAGSLTWLANGLQCIVDGQSTD